MKKRLVAGAGLAVLLLAQRASATTYCYTGVAGFSACASASIVVNGGLTQLQIAIQNLSGSLGNTKFAITQFGLYYLVPPNYTGSLTSLTPFTGWRNGMSNALLNPGPSAGTPAWVGGARTSNGVRYGLVGCLAPPISNPVSTCSGPATFTFSLAPGGNFSMQNLNVAIRGQSWSANNGAFVEQSFKCYSTDPNCQPPTAAVPEPFSMTLVATGLIGVGLIQFRRRRRKA